MKGIKVNTHIENSLAHCADAIKIIGKSIESKNIDSKSLENLSIALKMYANILEYHSHNLAKVE